MFSRPLSEFLTRHGVHYAWVVLAVTFVTALTTAGAVGIPGALILPLKQEFGWDTAQISSALAIRLLLFGLMAPFAAALIARYGVRPTVISAITLILAGLVGALFMDRVWHLVLAWGIVVGIGTGMTALVLSATIAIRWFVARRGLVIGVLAASTSTGQLVFLPMTTSLAQAHGWRVALMPPTGGLIFVALLILLFMRNRPSDLGLAPYGQTAGLQLAPPAPPTAAVRRAFEVLGEAVVTRTFWVLFGTFFVCGLSTNGLIQTYFIPFCADFGIAPVTAAGILAAMGVCDIFGTVGSGWLSDRVAPGKLLCWYYGLRGLALLFLPTSGFTGIGLAVFAVFYGLDWIATVPPTLKLANAAFGRERAPIVFGWIFTAHQIGGATAAFGAGLSRTILATYLPAFYIAGAACVAAACLALMARSPASTPSAAPVVHRV